MEPGPAPGNQEDRNAKVLLPAEMWTRDFYRAGSFTLLGGAAVSVFTALTGFWDWLKSTEPGTQVRRTANTRTRRW